MSSNLIKSDNPQLKPAYSPDLKIFFRDVRQGKKKQITVRSWSTIKDVKEVIQQKIHVPPSAQRLYFGPLLTSGKELPNHRSLHDVGIYRSGETLLLEINSRSSSLSASFSAFSSRSGATSNDITISSSVVDAAPRPLRSLIQEARRALALNLKPEFVLDGSGGTYFLKSSRGATIGVYKASDEEPYAVNNARGYLPQPGQDMFLRKGVVPGEGCIREVAAFMLDHGGFSGVPMTTLVECRHPTFNINGSRLTVAAGGASVGAHSLGQGSPGSTAIPKKVGSFQEFVRCECSMDDLSPSKVSVDEVHKIAILDIRLMNADRNSANLLCRRRRDNSIELVPIDHGFCLRSVADVSWMDWCWLDWPQLKEPMSKKTKQYIQNLDINKDVQILRERLNICDEALDYFYASSSILKAGAQAGLSLYDIAVMCCRNDNEGAIPSKLEVLFGMAGELAQSAIRNDRWGHAAASRALVEQLSPHGGSLLTPYAKKSTLSRRAASAFDLNEVALLSGIEKHSSADSNIPSMIQSAGSDSSSENGEAEIEECEEWAAQLIQDVSLETNQRLINSKPRSHSVGSDSSSDSSTDGFWQKNPGSVGESDDESSINWSLSSSPPNNGFDGSFLHDSRMSYNPFESARRSSFVVKDACDSAEILFTLPDRPPSKVTFAGVSPFGDDEKEADARFKHSNSDVGNKPAGIPSVPQKGGMRRSQSYSALTSTIQDTVRSEEERKNVKKIPSFTDEEYKSYYQKFVNLVIVREVTSAVLQKQEE
ncbi:phosphatidylinositol 3- and 4-kinase [Nitzschia inconspicua]|uniref:Phosphatidylinositol 3- and 4-kinase n=1 Tax=Nitzschia inconspicua TaxID=303405 RepID=A0A9K3PYN2_9STRA|nr:phosphatidylinositol 3- and 4-kinase [Nitzschia inconspicua]